MATTVPFRRRLSLRRTDGAVEGAIEDFMHHFEVRVAHGGGRVSGVEGRAVRAPWSTCPGAAAVLGELVGQPTGVLPRTDEPARHCTHMLDLATTAVRFAGAAARRRRFTMEVSGWDTGAVTAAGRRDDGLEFTLTMHKRTVVAPDALAGRGLGQGFAAAVFDAFDDDTAELALHVRRAAWMSVSQGIDLDDFPSLDTIGLPPGSCYASQPERIALGRRNRGASLPTLPW